MTPVLLYLLKVNIALLLFFLAYSYGLRRLTFYTANRAFLLFGIVFSSLYPLIDISRLLKKHTEIAGGVVYYLPNFSAAENPGAFNLPEILILVFWSGVAVMAFRFIIQIISLLRLHLSGQNGKVENMEVKLIDEKINPFSFFGNIYVNPSLHSEHELKTILEHEKIHVSDWHSADIILGEINRIFYWFNPGVWLMMTAIRENLEFITDRKILQKGTDVQEYQYSLVKVSNIPYASTLANNFNFSHLKARITMMDKKPSSELHLVKYLVLVPFVAALAILFTAFKAEQPKQTDSGAKIILQPVLPIDDTLPAKAPEEDLYAENIKVLINKADWIKNIDAGVPIVFDGKILNDHTALKGIINDKIRIMAKFSDELADYYVKGADVVYWIETKDAPDIKNRPDFPPPPPTVKEVRFTPPPPPVVKEVKFTPPKTEEKVKVKEIKFTPPKVIENDISGSTGVQSGKDNNEVSTIHIAGQTATYKLDEKSMTIKKVSDFILPYSQQNMLILVDGVKKEYKDIKTDEVASISIIKGDKVTELYGNKGKNGVVLISTKSNKKHSNELESVTVAGHPASKDDAVTVVGYLAPAKSSNKAVTVVGYPSKKEDNRNLIGRSKFEGKIDRGIVVEQPMNEPLVYIDGKLSSYAEMKKIPADEIDHINVLKGEKAIEKYGEDGKNGVIQITSKKQAEINDKKMAEWHKNQGKNPPLYIVDGKRISDKEFQKLDRNDIKAINVYKDAKAIEKYGNKAKHGVVVITTKDADKKD